VIGAAGDFAAALLRRMDAETAHGLAVKALACGIAPRGRADADPKLAVRFFDMSLPNPLGMAAGFDKNAEVPDALLSLGFGFAEVGTLTPRPQPGNPKPRIFRLPEAGAVINRLGFNNEGHAAALARLSARAGRPGVVGVNVGANKDSTDRAADYEAGIRAFAGVAGYFTANVSSPNTPGLRDLQAREALDELLARTLAARDAMAATVGRRVPVLLKIAPDMTEAGLDDVAEVSLARGIDGLIVSNTTVTRTGVSGPTAAEAGGLSGRPLFERSTIVLAKMRRRVGPAMPMVGVGGISDGHDAADKMRAGATLVQLYTGFIYGGASLPARILRELSAIVARDGLTAVGDLCGSAVDRWADRPIPA
jgi:dihydroorotate dehydrogenase